MSLGNFVIRLQFVIVKRLEAFVLGRRVHVGKQLMRIAEPADIVGCDDTQSNLREKVRHLQAPGRQPALDRLNRGPCVRGTQRMIPAFGLRHDRDKRIRFAALARLALPATLAGKRRQICEKRRGHIRHIARNNHDDVISRDRERRMQTAERPASRYQVGNGCQARPRRRRRPADQQNLVCNLRQFIHLAIEDRPPIDNECTLVLAPEPGRAPARQNRCAQHVHAILTH